MKYCRGLLLMVLIISFFNSFAQTEGKLKIVVNNQSEAELYLILDSLQNQSFDSVFNSLFEKRSIQPLAEKVLKKEINDQNEFLRRFFKIDDKKIIRQTKHSSSEYINNLIEKKNIPFSYEFSDRFPAYNLKFPVDWRANPNRNNSWELYLLNFDWMDIWYKTDDNINGMDVDQKDRVLLGMHAIYDFYNQEFSYPSDQKYVWYDHAISRRLERVVECTEAYKYLFDTLDSELLNAAANIIISHTYALASTSFYPRIPHNHGFMMDNALLLSASKLPFYEREDLITISMARIRLQLIKSVTANGIHMEHSPGYQTFYVYLINDVIENLMKLNLEIPKYLVETQKALISSCTYFIQPNLTHIQFGDTKGGSRPIREFAIEVERFKSMLNISREFTDLEFVLSKGVNGTKPEDVDVVYKDGGYALFRDKWGDSSNFDDQIMAGFKANNFSWTHYHRDDTTFSIYGYGKEIIVDAGHHNFNRKDSLTFYQYSAYGHNVLIIDDENFRPSKRNFGKSKILDYQLGDSISWVKASHPHYKGFGIKDQERTFIFKKPNKFIVKDNLESKDEHKYKQLIHFHPDYIEMKKIDDYSCLIRTKSPEDPEVIVRSKNKCEYNISRGVLKEGKAQGWYFPDANVVKDCIALEINFKDRTAGKKTFETELEIVQPTRAH